MRVTRGRFRVGGRRFAAGLLLGLLCHGAAAGAPAPTASEEFFIVSSVDAGRGRMVLKRPTEVTLTMRLTAQTRCRSETGKPMRASDLKAGDTVFISSTRSPDGPVASTVREGIMTVPELHRLYFVGAGSASGASSR